MSTKYKLSLALLALIGAILALLSTSRYGAGLSPDSVSYISTARNLIKGEGFIGDDGEPMVRWPPLYPVLLALVGAIFGIDPLLPAYIVNALIFGLIVYFGGLLAFKYLLSFPVLALVGTLAILFSTPLFAVSVMAWSEPLFILFVLLCLIFSAFYLSKNDTTTLILLSLSVALSFLSRYVGVTLILWGALIVVIFHRDGLKSKLAHLSLFTLISALPMGIWLIRNYAVAHTLFGFPAGSAYTLSQNLTLLFNSILYWYLPGIIANYRPTLMLLGAAIGFFVGLSFKDSWQNMKVNLRQISPTVLFSISSGLFVIIYTVFVVISATNTDVSVDNRMLSPVYVPLTLLLLILTETLVDPYRKRFSKKIVNSFLIIGIAIWLIYPIRATILKAVKQTQIGEGYSGQAWMDSETIQYLLQHRTLESECTVYTNGPDAVYILAHLATQLSPARTKYNYIETVNDISSLRGRWPEDNKACLVWFDELDWRKYLFTIDELQAIANIDLIARLEDGAIYSITRK